MSEADLKDFPSLFSLNGKVVVVTGGSRGLGLHAASAFLQAGASKVIITSRSAPACQSAVATLNSLRSRTITGTAISCPADLSTQSGVTSLVAQVLTHTSHVDILFANAGASWGAPLPTHPDAAIAKVFDLNVRSVFNTIRDFLPLLSARGTLQDRLENPSRVIITASVAGLGIGTLGKNGTYGYSASKAAVIHLGRNLAVELGPKGITVNCIAPGFFPSKMANGLLELSGGTAKIAAKNPMRRLGRGEDIAGVVTFLASRGGAHVNGVVVPVDGGAMWDRGELNVEEVEAKL